MTLPSGEQVAAVVEVVDLRGWWVRVAFLDIEPRAREKLVRLVFSRERAALAQRRERRTVEVRDTAPTNDAAPGSTVGSSPQAGAAHRAGAGQRAADPGVVRPLRPARRRPAGRRPL